MHLAAEAWSIRASIPNLPINGTYSGVVQGPVGATYDKVSGVIQSFNARAHHFQGFTNTVQVSADHGKNWVAVFNEGQDANFNKAAFGGFSLPHPSIPKARLHFQIRWDWVKSFFVAVGTLQPGGIDLYFSENGTTWNFLQRLHSWPALNEVGGNGGAAAWSVFPTLAPPILLPGSGPTGQDAYWMATAYSFDAGGAGNRTTFKACTLWRSIDGVEWTNVRDLEAAFGAIVSVRYFFESRNRIFIADEIGARYTDGANLITAAFTASIVGTGGGSLGQIEAMHGGTLVTHRSGSLIAGGNAFVSCDNGATWIGGPVVVPVNQTGYLVKMGPSEGLIVAPSFTDPTTKTVSEYSADGGETWEVGPPWIISTIGERPVFIGLQPSGQPLVITRAGRVWVNSERGDGVFQTRTVCPLANAGLAKAAGLPNCGHPIHVDSCP